MLSGGSLGAFGIRWGLRSACRVRVGLAFASTCECVCVLPCSCACVWTRSACASTCVRACARAEVPLGLCLLWTRDFLQGLEFMHGRGVIHRDLAAKNLLLRVDPLTAVMRLLIADFGTSRRHAETMTPKRGTLWFHVEKTSRQKHPTFEISTLLAQLPRGRRARHQCHISHCVSAQLPRGRVASPSNSSLCFFCHGHAFAL